MNSNTIPLGPLISAINLGISFPRVRDRVAGISMSLNDTSGGMESAAPPTRDCAGDVVEKHCVRGEKAGARKMGREPRWKGSRRSWRAQRWGMEHDMVICACWVGCCDCGLWILFRRWIASIGFSVHVIIYILVASRFLPRFHSIVCLEYHIMISA